ncbi:unnamed protein product [Rotaria magnacalcarata]|uniref:Uncharacterized protein n=1 Tax=Rotaria magnacalcarata TaxID=392030 RepID=A0A816SNH6_9BILA|nr:unnamed protein product [Rotaria magnacalcarata]CAF2251263.1 unnamed protein product [Rotaria magnacalcarata]
MKISYAFFRFHVYIGFLGTTFDLNNNETVYPIWKKTAGSDSTPSVSGPNYALRDPISITSEGSNQAAAILNIDSSGLGTDPGRGQCGVQQNFTTNTI